MKKKIKHRLIERFLLNLSINSFMLAMRMEKRKYPLYWIGPDFKNFKYSTWMSVLSNLLRTKMKTHNWSVCTIVADTNHKVTVAKIGFPGFDDSYFRDMCFKGAGIWQRVINGEGADGPK